MALCSRTLAIDNTRMCRYCFTVEVKPDKLAAYKKYHDEIFPEVAHTALLKNCTVRSARPLPIGT